MGYKRQLLKLTIEDSVDEVIILTGEDNTPQYHALKVTAEFMDDERWYEANIEVLIDDVPEQGFPLDEERPYVG